MSFRGGAGHITRWARKGVMVPPTPSVGRDVSR
jgi:hypothetical protein